MSGGQKTENDEVGRVTRALSKDQLHMFWGNHAVAQRVAIETIATLQEVVRGSRLLH